MEGHQLATGVVLVLVASLFSCVTQDDEPVPISGDASEASDGRVGGDDAGGDETGGDDAGGAETGGDDASGTDERAEACADLAATLCERADEACGGSAGFGIDLGAGRPHAYTSVEQCSAAAPIDDQGCRNAAESALESCRNAIQSASCSDQSLVVSDECLFGDG